MRTGTRIAVIAVVAVAAFAALRWGGRSGEAPAGDAAPASAPLPTLLDLGSKQCIPCKKMAPILAELERECAGRIEVVFIDVREDAEAAATYGIRLIPTQIFYAADGSELYRHEGFLGKQAILDKWRELGVEPGDGAAARGTVGG
jgi:thioredoxin 1